MDEETLGRLRGICADYPQPAQRAPDREEFITRVMAVRRGAGVAYEDNFFWASAACCIYGTPGVSPNPARVREVRQYLIRWRDRSDGVCLQEEQLLPLGFCCALRVNPDPHEPGPPGDPWPGAVGVLLAQLAGFAGGLIGGLHTVGFHNADLLDSFQSGGGGQVIAAHTLGVIMGHTRCMCGPTFYAAVGAGHGGRQAHHHACQHILPSWVNPEYPAAFLEAHPPDPPEPGGIDGDDTAWLPFSAFVYRAVCGPCGSPTRPRALRYGIWFSLLRDDGGSLVIRSVIRCTGCGAHLPGWGACPGCQVPSPHNTLIDWLANEDDSCFVPGVGKRCKGCGRLVPLWATSCPCGSASFSGRPTNFYFRLNAHHPLDPDEPPGGGSRRSGGRRSGRFANPAEEGGSDAPSGRSGRVGTIRL